MGEEIKAGRDASPEGAAPGGRTGEGGAPPRGEESDPRRQPDDALGGVGGDPAAPGASAPAGARRRPRSILGRLAYRLGISKRDLQWRLLSAAALGVVLVAIALVLK